MTGHKDHIWNINIVISYQTQDEATWHWCEPTSQCLITIKKTLTQCVYFRIPNGLAWNLFTSPVDWIRIFKKPHPPWTKTWTCSYLNGLSPVWVNMWVLTDFFSVKHFKHSGHWKLLIPAWVFSCRFRFVFVVNDLGQEVQEYGFSPEWLREWTETEIIYVIGIRVTPYEWC